ncbi:MAG: GlsB/YeaQ/YmgE family stress response membrane protein [Acetobacteraceae bacterium]|nr:MAG: GlsB/YeaQ/YmgE family stress response membrane protein [Acetobacteraceae bacterium]
MAIEALLVTLLIGAIAGWLAGLIVKGYGFGLLGNIVVGIVGALIASFLFPQLGFVVGGSPIVGSIIHATIGAVILLLLIRLIRRA